MDFLAAVTETFGKLDDFTIVTRLWKEIIEGKVAEVTSEQIIQYSFHYPVDTELYLRELNNLFDTSSKDGLRTIDGNLKAYLITFLYYCICATDRISLKTSLSAATLYLKLVSIPSGIGEIFFEKNVYKSCLQICVDGTKVEAFQESVKTLLEHIRDFSTKETSKSKYVVGFTANTFAAIVMHTGQSDCMMQDSADNISAYSLECLKKMIFENEEADAVKLVLESLLRCLRKQCCERVSLDRRRLTISIFTGFIKELLKDLEDCKVQYLLDAMFLTFEKPDFDCFEESVVIFNMLDRENYISVLTKLCNYLSSKNHKKYHLIMMNLVYEMIINVPPFGLEKLDVFFTVCLKHILMHILSKSKNIQEKAIETLARICLLNENYIMKKIFEVCGTTNKFLLLCPATVLRAICSICGEQWGGTSRNKNITIIVSKLLINTTAVDAEFSSMIIYILCKDCTPFTLRPLLPFLHELYLNMTTKREFEICRQILKIFFRNALHQDATSIVFLEHLFNSLTHPSTINGVEYKPECYSDIFLTDYFDYTTFFNKCSRLIKYKHIDKTIANFDYQKSGHSVLLNCLLDFIPYKETNILLDYLIDKFDDLCVTEHAGILFEAFGKIVKNKKIFTIFEIPKIDVLVSLIWDAMYQQNLVVCNIKPAMDLVYSLKDILNLTEGTEKETLMSTISQSAYEALTQKNYNSGSIMYLTELCVVLKRMPDRRILQIFETVMQTPETANLLKVYSKAYLIQMLSFFTTIAILDKEKVPFAVALLKDSLEVESVVLRITALKLLYALCTEITHEFDDVIRFIVARICDKDPCLSRVCVTIMEELIHDNYVLLKAEEFLKFIYRLGCPDLHIFMRQILDKRFILSNKNDIGRYYMSSLVYLSGYTKFDNYPVSSDFTEDLKKIKLMVDCPKDIFSYLFNALPLKTRFNVLKEIATIFEKLILGQFKVDENFFTCLTHCLYTFKVMAVKYDVPYAKNYYPQVCKKIETQILAKDPKFKDASFYGEYSHDVKKCTLALLEFLFFIAEDRLMRSLKFNTFDVAIYWIDHVKPEIVHYVHHEKGTEYNMQLTKLVAYYKANKEYLDNLANNQESICEVIYVE